MFNLRETLAGLMVRAKASLRVPLAGELPDGPVLIGCNYVNTIDVIRVINSLGRPATSLTPDAVIPWLKRKRKTELERETLAANAIKRGQLVIVFPEGKPTTDGALHRGYPEIARLALYFKIPLVPAALTKRDGIDHLVIAKPLDLTRYQQAPASTAKVELFWMQAITDELMKIIAELSGQQYIDTTVRQARADLAAKAKQAQQDNDHAWQQYQQKMAQIRAQAVAREQDERNQLEQAAAAARQYAKQIAAEESKGK